MKIKLEVIKEAVEIIKEHINNPNVVIEQCRLIIKYANEIKKQQK